MLILSDSKRCRLINQFITLFVVCCYVYLCLIKLSLFVIRVAEIELTVDRDEWKRLLISVMNRCC